MDGLSHSWMYKTPTSDKASFYDSEFYSIILKYRYIDHIMKVLLMNFTTFDRNDVCDFPESFSSIIQCKQILHLLVNLPVTVNLSEKLIGIDQPDLI